MQRFFLCIVFLFLGCQPPEKKVKEITLRPDTTLLVYQTVRSGMLEPSVYTSLSIKWPRAYLQEKIGQAPYFGGTEDIQFIEIPDWYILVYGSTIFYRNTNGDKWSKWLARNSDYSPPDPSVASFLRDWFIAHSHADYDYIPFGSKIDSNETIPFEQISFHEKASGKPIIFGSRTNWTIPYKFDSADSKTNTIYFSTEDPALPRYLAFRGAMGNFGGWFFDPLTTAAKNKNTEAEQTDAANRHSFGTSVMPPADSASRAGATPEAGGDS